MNRPSVSRLVTASSTSIVSHRGRIRRSRSRAEEEHRLLDPPARLVDLALAPARELGAALLELGEPAANPLPLASKPPHVGKPVRERVEQRSDPGGACARGRPETPRQTRSIAL